MRIGIYCLDQDHRSTASMGLYNYLKQLIAHMAKMPDPGFELILIVASANADDLCPKNMPPWITADIVQGSFSSGFKRIYADHLLSIKRAKALGLSAMHFPKGPIPASIPRGLRVISTIADAIVFRYGKDFVGGIPALKRLYFKGCAKRALNRADRIITISDDSRNDLSALIAEDRTRIRTIYPGPGLLSTQHAGESTRTAKSGIVVMGSHRPHKATEETLQLLGKYATHKNIQMDVTVVSIDGPSPHWNTLPSSVSIHFKGRVPDTDLMELLGRSQALVYLSKKEGFGLPCIESYLCGTPVCYRNSTSIAEIMRGIPGGWDGNSDEGFFQAMDSILNMPENDISAVANSFRKRFRWSSAAENTVELYREATAPTRLKFGALECSSHNIDELISDIVFLLKQPSERPRIITCLNAHIYNVASKNPQLKQDLLASRIIAADGMPIVWLSALLSKTSPRSRCNMTEAFDAFLASSEVPKSTALIIGLDKQGAQAAMARVNSLSSNCTVVDVIDGYRTEEEYRESLNGHAGLSMVLVGMGSPRSERIAQIAAEAMPEAVVWHIGGGTLSILAGRSSLAPKWMRKAGLQWLHRLVQEPRRMFARYFFGNPMFVFRLFRDHITRNRQP